MRRLTNAGNSLTIILLAVVLLFLSRAGASWTRLYLSQPWTAGLSMSFVTPETGYVAGDDGCLRKTTDGGLSFREIAHPAFGWEVLALNETLCLAFELSDWEVWHIQPWKSTDGGDSWRRIGRPYGFDPNHGARFGDLFSFPDPDHGYVIAAGSPNLLRTANGGDTWTPKSVPDSPLIGVSFLDSITGYAATEQHVWQTSDAGEHWNLRAAFADTWLIGNLRFVSEQTGYVFAEIGNSDGLVLKTTDAGMTWQTVFRVSSHNGYSANDLVGMCFSSADTGYVAGEWEGAEFEHVRLYKTCNGQDFRRVQLPRRVVSYCNMYFCPGTQTGYLSVIEESGDSETCPILKTVDGCGESLAFWHPSAHLPEKPKKGVALDFVPDSSALFLLMKGSGNLWSYNLNTETWRPGRAIPTKFRTGTMVYDGVGLVVSKANANEFWSFELESDTWIQLPGLPEKIKVKKGGCITSDAGDPVFALIGGKTNQFWAYDRGTESWSRRPDIPGTPVKAGGCSACDNDFVYVLKGGKTNEFWAYDIAGDSWVRLLDIPGSGVKDGSCLAANPRAPNGRVVALKGGTSECWTYELDGYWQLRPGIAGKKTKAGAQLTADDANSYYALPSAKSPNIWQTDELAFDFSEVPPRVARDQTQSASGATEGTRCGIMSPLSLRISNPSDGRTISVTSRRRLALEVFDISGRRQFAFNKTEPGSTRIELPRPLARGIYIVRSVAPRSNISSKLIVVN